MTLIDHELTTFGKGDVDLDTPKPHVSHQGRASIQEYETGLVAPLSVHNTIVIHQTRWLAVILPRSPHGNLTLGGYISYQPCRLSELRSGIIDRFDPIRATLSTSLWIFRKLFDLLFRSMGLDFFSGRYLWVCVKDVRECFIHVKKNEKRTRNMRYWSRDTLILNEDLSWTTFSIWPWISRTCFCDIRVCARRVMKKNSLEYNVQESYYSILSC